MKADISNFTRKLKLREKFWDSQQKDTSIVKNKSKLDIHCTDTDLSQIIDNINSITLLATKKEHNLPAEELKALKELKSYNDIVIKKADKSSTLIIMDDEVYKDKLVLKDDLHRTTYELVSNKTDHKAIQDLKILTHKHSSCLTTQEISYINNKEWKSSQFYTLPKIHKNEAIINKVKQSKTSYIQIEIPLELKGRPIIAGPLCPTQRLSELLEKILTPLVSHLKSYIKDDWDFLRKLPNSVNYDSKLITYDIVSLYTSIPHDLGIAAIRYWFNNKRYLIPSRFSEEFVLESCLFVLSNNNFMFDSNHYHQLKGTKFAPPYACLTIGYLEETKLYIELPFHFSTSSCVLIQNMFCRFIDDGYILWPSELDINIFTNILNNISFTVEPGAHHVSEDGEITEQINFLDAF